MSNEIIGLLGYLLEDHDFADHPRGEGRAKTFLDDLKSHGYEIVPRWSTDLDAAPRDGTPILAFYPKDPAFPIGDSIKTARWVEGFFDGKDGFLDYAEHEEFSHPTHWKPITPPKESE